MLAHALPRPLHDAARFVRPPKPIEFPAEALVPETQLHLDLRTILYQLLLDHLGPGVTVGSDQFVYFVANDPRRSVAPDAYVKRVPRGEPIRTWKTWERGAPDVAVEIVSDSDDDEPGWQSKLARYHEIGVEEVVRFDPRGGEEGRLQVWNRIDGDLVERVVERERVRSRVLELTWVVAPADGYPAALRLARGADGQELAPTRSEAREAEARGREAEARAREAEARAREAEAKGREAAERRVAELEAELRRRGG